MNVSRWLLTLAFVLAAVFGGSGVASAAPKPEERPHFIVLAEQAEGQQALISCTSGEVDFSLLLYPFGGGALDVLPDGVECDPEMLMGIFPGSQVAIFDSPQKGWTVKPGPEEGQIIATRCNLDGTLVKVSPGPQGWRTWSEDEVNSSSC